MRDGEKAEKKVEMCFLSDLVGFELEDAVLEESELVSSMPVLANEDKDAPDV